MKLAEKIALGYLVIGLIWIYFSDSLAQVIFGDEDVESITYFQNIKGFFFISATTLILYAVIKGQIRKQESKDSGNGRRRKHRKIEENPSFYQALLSNSHDGILIYDERRIVEYASPSAGRVLGYPREVLEGLDIRSIIFYEDVTEGDELIKSIIRGEDDAAVFHIRMNYGKGGIIWVEALITTFNDNQGRLLFIANFRDVTIQHEAKKELEETNKKLNSELVFKQTVLDQSVDIICTISKEGDFVQVNNAFEFIAGYKPEELEGKSCFSIVYLDDVTVTQDQFGETSGSAVYNFVNRIVSKSGELIHIEWSGRWVESEQLIFAIGRDVTQEVERQRLVVFKSKVLDMLRSTGTSYAYSNILKIIAEETNSEATELWIPTLTKESFYLKNYYTSGEVDQECFKSLKKTFISSSDSFFQNIGNGNTEYVLEDLSEEKHFERKEVLMMCGVRRLVAIPLVHNGELVGILNLLVKNITVRDQKLKSIQEVIPLWAGDIKRRNEEEMYQTIFSISKDIFCVIKEDGKPIWFNPALGRVLKYMPDQLVEMSIVDFAIDQDRENTELFLRSLKEGYGGSHLIHRVKTAEGRVVWLSWTGVNFTKENVIVLSARDISERKRTELELQQLNSKLKDRAEELELSNNVLEKFAHIVSHDLQEPLRMISGFLTLLESNYAEQLDEKGGKYIKFSTDAAKRMSGLLNDLLAYSRIDSRGLIGEEVDLNEIVENVKVLLRNEIQTSGATIIYESLPKVKGGRMLLNQLMQNLISNSIKYNDSENPVVEIGAIQKQKEGTVQVYVKDNGLGIKEKDFERIFLVFQRGENAMGIEGTGMGLAICKRIVDIHKGKVWVESDRTGTTMWVELNDKRVLE